MTETRIQETLQLWAILQSLLAGDRDAPRIVLFTVNCRGDGGLSSLLFLKGSTLLYFDNKQINKSVRYQTCTLKIVCTYLHFLKICMRAFIIYSSDLSGGSGASTEEKGAIPVVPEFLVQCAR